MKKNSKGKGGRKNKFSASSEAKAIRRASKARRNKKYDRHFGEGRGHSHGVIVTGIFSASTRGFGFVTPDEEYGIAEDIFIPAKKCKNALGGDKVTVSVHKFADTREKELRMRSEGEILSIEERGKTEICGTLILDTALIGRRFSPFRVIPDDTHFGTEIEVPDLGEMPIGNKVLVKITDYGNGRIPPKGEIIQDMGKALSLGANYEAILHEYGIPTEFPDDVKESAEEAASEEITADGREDLRALNILTIDGADAKDLDDAISLEVKDNGYLLGVHIADVSHYVTHNSAIDREARARGTSVYFVDKVVPMLPKCLSNGVCSLNAGTDKYSLSALISLDKEGKIVGCEIKNSIINSKVRGVYSEVNDLFEHKSRSKFYSKYKVCYRELCEMFKLYKILDNRAKKRGVLSLESAEARFVLDESGAPVEIIKRERGDAEMLIEQFMLTANEAVARYMSAARIPCVYRIHEAPDKEKLAAYKSFIQSMGLSTLSVAGDKVVTASFAPILAEAEKKDVLSVVSRVTLRAQMKAKYSERRQDHFGLGLEYYCHFTSPIRRYPDLTVHRILKYAMSQGNTMADRKFNAFAAESATKSSENELRAVNAERDIEDLYKVIFMEKNVGETFAATVSGVTSFGVFCELENTCEGFIPTEVIGDGCKYDEKTQSLFAHGKTIRLGQSVTVKITEANVMRRRVYMELV